MKWSFTLVMTASVSPNGMMGISSESIVNRERQYIDTLRFYASQRCIDNILFVENSNYPLGNIKNAVEEYSNKITWLSLDENNYPREWGKGYGEFLLMDKAIKYLSEQYVGGEGVVIKVTGRFPILNIKTMIEEFARRRNLKLAIDIIDHRIFDILGLRWRGHCARTVLYAITLKFYREKVMGRYKDIPFKYSSAEELMFAVYREAKDFPGIYPRFQTEPLMSGCSGSCNTTWLTANNYESRLSRIKRAIRQCVRIVAPYIWL